MSHKIIPGLLLAVLTLMPGCSRRPAAGSLPVTAVWHRSQERITPQAAGTNAWEGLRADADAFTAEGGYSQFILWRARAEKVPVTIEYSLQGRRVLFTVNVRKARWLAPSSAFKRETYDFPLSAGMNFLGFTQKGKSTLRIRSITVGGQPGQAGALLRPGESFDIFLRPGRGRLVLEGRGRAEVSEQAGDGEGARPVVRRLKRGWLSKTISVPLAFSAPGLLTVKALGGELAVRSYEYAEVPAADTPPPAAVEGKPDICIILSDACQASHLGAYGYARPTSPHIDALARDGVVYENAYTNAVFTRSSVATLLTGLYPDSHKTRVLQNSLPKQFLTLPEFLKAKGYRTMITTSTFAISPHFGFTQGVDDYFRVSEKGRPRRDASSMEASIQERFAAWLAGAPSPAFSYLHYIHPHFPKVPPPDFPVNFRPGRERTTQERLALLVRAPKRTGSPPAPDELQEITDAYDSSIAWVDSEVGAILERMRERKRYEGSMIVFLADHGEALAEHGVLGHGSNVYEETARVPLIVKYPAAMGLRGRERRLVEIADLFPTIAGMFGQRLEMDGRSMRPPHDAGESRERLVVSRTLNRCAKYGLRWRDWYYMIDLGNNQEQLFSLAADPLREVGRRHPRARAFLKARFLDWYARFRDLKDYSLQVNLKNLPAEEIEEMKTLGYL